jgi:hypothetical protein
MIISLGQVSCAGFVGPMTPDEQAACAAGSSVCNPFWSAMNGACSDAGGNYVTPTGAVIPGSTVAAVTAGMYGSPSPTAIAGFSLGTVGIFVIAILVLLFLFKR